MPEEVTSTETETETTTETGNGPEDVTGLKTALTTERARAKELERQVRELTAKVNPTSTEGGTKTGGTQPSQESKAEAPAEVQALLTRFLKGDAEKVFGGLKWNKGVKFDQVVPDISKFAKGAEIDADALKSHLTKFQEENEWARQQAEGADGSSASGTSGKGDLKGKLTREDLQRMRAAGQNDEILQAYREGRIAGL